MTDKPSKSKQPKKQPTGDYEVGYGKPPKSAKWQPGKSANPSGRPKKLPCPHEMLMEEALKPVLITVGHNVVEMTGVQVVYLKLMHQAAKGDTKAMKMFFAAFAKAHGVLSKASLPQEEEFSWSDEQEALHQELNKLLEDEGDK